MATRPRAAGTDTFIQQSRNAKPGQKAEWHDVTGAGRSRVLRPFFQLTAADEDALVREITQRIERRLAAQ